jgi:hypothetical protein
MVERVNELTVSRVNVAPTPRVCIDSHKRGKLKKAHLLSCAFSDFKAANYGSSPRGTHCAALTLHTETRGNRVCCSACRLAGLSAVNHFIRSTRFMCGLGFVEPERVSTYRRGASCRKKARPMAGLLFCSHPSRMDFGSTIWGNIHPATKTAIVGFRPTKYRHSRPQIQNRRHRIS